MKKRVIIAGGGFAGISAARVFSRFTKYVECTVIDRKENFEFLPLLPDVIGGKVRPDFLKASLAALGRKLNFTFRNDVVESIAPAEKKIFGRKGAADYDYALISCGSETNFYGNAAIEAGARKLGNVDDAVRIAEIVDGDRCETYVISGGGYTGIEVAANLRFRLDKAGKKRKIVIIEGGPLILGSLPGWIRDYAAEGLKKMGVDLMVDTKVAGLEKDIIILSDGRRFARSLLIWTAGVKIPDFIGNIDREKTAQGRISVTGDLGIGRSCFLAGDAADFVSSGKPLRMSIQFALSEGSCAARNIIRDIKSAGLKNYRPFDPGYIIPMSAGTACGKALNVNVKGRAALFLHYLMCIYRSYGLRNKFGILCNLLRR